MNTNRVIRLEFKKPNMDHSQRVLTGRIVGENCDFFVIELNPDTGLYELLVRDGVPISLRGPHQWYKLAEGSQDFCYGYLNGKYKKIEEKA